MMVAPGMQGIYFRVLCTFQYLIYYRPTRVGVEEGALNDCGSLGMLNL